MEKFSVTSIELIEVLQLRVYRLAQRIKQMESRLNKIQYEIELNKKVVMEDKKRV